MSALLRDAPVLRDLAGGHPGAARRAEDPAAIARRPLLGLDGALIVLAALVAVAAWTPFLAQPLSPDEAGFLHVALHWHPGTSLYGDYWVDRPPLLMWLFDLAGHLSPLVHRANGLSAPGVKVMGAAATGLAVALAGVLTRQLVPARRGALLLVLVAAAGLLADPLLGMPSANGEVLSLPFVMTGVVSLVTAHRLPWGARAAALSLLAGAAAVAAALVKQNVVDVVVLAAVLVPFGRRAGDRWVGRLLLFAVGGLTSLGVTLVSAAARGTSPQALWDAVALFRLRAASVISAAATSSTTDRAHALTLAALASGEVLLLVVAAVAAVRQRPGNQRSGDPAARRRSPRPDRLVWAGAAVVAWEAFAVVAGGSYWSHYLTGLVPGALLLLSLALRAPRAFVARALTVAVAVVATAGATAWTVPASAGTPRSTDDGRVETFLRTHAAPTDGVVSAFGDPRIVAGSGLTSPYEHLWSLPVRVRDPDLADLTRVLSGPTPPRWVVVSGHGLGTWGVDATRAQRVFDRDYQHRVTYGAWEIFEHRDSPEGGTP